MEIVDYVALRKAEIREEIPHLKKKPTLAIIVVGNNPASEAYVRGKLKDAAEVGFTAIDYRFDENVSEEEVLAKIRECNQNPEIDGLLVQLPVPKHISTEKINATIDPAKDVDGFCLGTKFDCCTPKGIIDYLARDGFSFTGKNAVVFGRSAIVGKPMANLLLARNCNVTVLHSKTSEEDRRFYAKHADLIVVAIGKMGLIDHTYEFKESCVVVDVGINRGEDGHLHGDCVPGLPVAKQTPVPKGVGLLTRLALLENLLEAAKR